MLTEIQELAVILSLATAIGALAKVLRLPMIIAYLGAGAVLALSGVLPAAAGSLYQLFGQLGIMFLLFLIGLEINYTSLRLVGLTSVVIGLTQVVVSLAIGTMIGVILGWAPLSAAYLGVVAAFASTVVVVKLLTEKHELNSLHGKIALGLMLVQDFVAMILLVVLAGFQAGHGIEFSVMLWTVAKTAIIFIAMLWLGRTAIPRILHRVAHTPELLFLGSIAWLFVVASTSIALGLSVEIGGFMAGLAMANSSEQFHIANRLRPLRDFFLVLLFITLGASLGAPHLGQVLGSVVIIVAAVTLINPIIVSLLLLGRGYHRRTAVITGLHISQISEFSLVIAAIGLRLGHLNNEMVTTITLAAILSIGLSSVMVLHSEAVYRWLRRTLHWHDVPISRRNRTGAVDIVLIGANRLGRNILRSIGTKRVLVVDYDPDVIARLHREGFEATYGDIGDEDVTQHIAVLRPKTIISTSPDVEDNAGILRLFRTKNRRDCLVVVRADTDREARTLYGLGADFVLLPHLMSGLSLGEVIRHNNLPMLRSWKSNDLKYLQETHG